MILAHQKALVVLNQADRSAHSIEGATPADDETAVPKDIEAQLRHYNFFLEQLLGLISSSDEESVWRVISVIRSGGSHRQILDIIEQQSERKSQAGRKGGHISRASRAS